MGPVIKLVFTFVFGFSQWRERQLAGSHVFTAGRFAGASTAGVLRNVTNSGMIPNACEVGLAVRQAWHWLRLRADRDHNDGGDNDTDQYCNNVLVHCAPYFVLGTASSAAAVKTERPSGNVTCPPDPFGEPSFARNPSTFTTSPALRKSLLIPRRAKVEGGPAEKPHTAV